MKLNELIYHHLLETTQDEEALQRLADEVVPAIMKAFMKWEPNATGFDKDQYVKNGSRPMGKIEKYVKDDSLLDKLPVGFRSLRVALTNEPLASSPYSHAWYNRSDRTATFYIYPDLREAMEKAYKDEGELPLRFLRDLDNSFIHEFRHGLDHKTDKRFKQKKHTDWWTSSYVEPWKNKYTKHTGENPNDDFGSSEYMGSAHEINARVSTAMRDVGTSIHQLDMHPRNNEELKKIVYRAIDRNHLVAAFKSERDGPRRDSDYTTDDEYGGDDYKYPIDNPAFRQVFNRLLQFGQHVIERDSNPPIERREKYRLVKDILSKASDLTSKDLSVLTSNELKELGNMKNYAWTKNAEEREANGYASEAEALNSAIYSQYEYFIDYHHRGTR